MPLTRSKPPRRTGFSRHEGQSLSSFGKGKPFSRKAGIRAKRKKVTVAEGSKYLAACRGESCYLRIPGVCNGDWDTCVPAHRNEGKGMGLKVSNELSLPACYACHAEFDQGKKFLRQEKRDMWSEAFERWKPVRDGKLGICEMEPA